MANGCRAQSSRCVGSIFSNGSSAPGPRLTRVPGLKQSQPSACPERGGVVRIVATLLRTANRGSPNGSPSTASMPMKATRAICVWVVTLGTRYDRRMFPDIRTLSCEGGRASPWRLQLSGSPERLSIVPWSLDFKDQRRRGGRLRKSVPYAGLELERACKGSRGSRRRSRAPRRFPAQRRRGGSQRSFRTAQPNANAVSRRALGARQLILGKPPRV